MIVPAVPLVALLVSGCYSYVGLGNRTPSNGADLRLELAPPRDVTLQTVTLHDVTGLQGRLVSLDGDSMGVSVRRLWGLEGRSYEALGIGVNVPRNAIATVSEKRVSAPRTGMAVVALSAAIAGVIFSVRELVGAGGGTRPKPQP
jgi:hypothetical protein